MNEEQWPDDVDEEDNDKTKSVVSDDTDELPGPGTIPSSLFDSFIAYHWH